MKHAFWLLLALTLPAWAKLQFESTFLEVRLPAAAEEGTAIYHFTNAGTKAETIATVVMNCDCLKVEAAGGKITADGKREYAPGEAGTIRMQFKVGNSVGEVEQAVGLVMQSDPKGQPSIGLSVRFIIPELVLLEPKVLKWQQGTPATPQKISITMHDPSGVRITKVSSTSEDYQLELKTVQEGRSYELLVTPKHIDSPGSTVIEVHTDCTAEKQRIQQAFAMIMRSQP